MGAFPEQKMLRAGRPGTSHLPSNSAKGQSATHLQFINSATGQPLGKLILCTKHEATCPVFCNFHNVSTPPTYNKDCGGK